LTPEYKEERDQLIAAIKQGLVPKEKNGNERRWGSDTICILSSSWINKNLTHIKMIVDHVSVTLKRYITQLIHLSFSDVAIPPTGRPITGPELATLLEIMVTAANEGSLAEVSS